VPDSYKQDRRRRAGAISEFWGVAGWANIREAIDGYILALKDDNLPVPPERFDAMLLAV